MSEITKQSHFPPATQNRVTNNAIKATVSGFSTLGTSDRTTKHGRPNSVNLGHIGKLAILIGLFLAAHAVSAQTHSFCNQPTSSHSESSRQAGAHVSSQSLANVPHNPPNWARDAIWYQLIIPRFRNGDPNNDLPYTVPWCHDWLAKADHEEWDLDVALHFRRYGGDIQGLQDRLGYLRRLGVNAICLSPVFHADSENKYGTIDYRHVDPSFGPPTENGVSHDENLNPDTWRWTSADLSFTEFLSEAHRQGFRVVIDGVFNHCGKQFWAWQDVMKNGRNSPYSDWFDVTSWQPELHWNGWDGPDGMLIRYRRKNGFLHPKLEAHLFNVVQRWMDPNGDGDPTDGVDGWRLDAADEVPPPFWRRFRQVVKRINPQAIIVGEVWGDPQPWLSGDIFDAVTDYQFAIPTVEFLRAGSRALTPTEYSREFEKLPYLLGNGPGSAGWNILGTHDTPRAVSMLSNQYRGFPWEGMTASDAADSGEAPPPNAYKRLALAATLQFTLPGTPMIYYGDEVGMFGADDPYCRAPMWWPDLCTSESALISYNRCLLAHYHRLCRLRQKSKPLSHGSYSLLLADDSKRILAYSRRHRNECVVIVVNAAVDKQEVYLSLASPDRTFTSEWYGIFGELREWQAVAQPSHTQRSKFTSTLQADGTGLLRTVVPPLSSVLLTANSPSHTPSVP